MSFIEKIYYCICIRKNRFRYSAFGREANRTLKSLEVPSSTPNWVKTISIIEFKNPIQSILNNKINLNYKSWHLFRYPDIFNIERGYYNKRPVKYGNINFVSASTQNNGVSDKLSEDIIEKLYDGNCITVANNGHVGAAFYQKEKFTCSHDVNVLRIKNKEMNVFIGMFLIPLINLEKLHYHYGRKWRFERMEKTTIKLPINAIGEPDWIFMENYIKSLNYSNLLISTIS